MKKLVTVILAGLVLAACAESADPADSTAAPAVDTTVAETTPPTTSAPDTTTESTTAPDDGAKINISGSSFGGPVTVSVGETVEVTNSDPLPHTWTSEDGVFNSGTLSEGDTFSFTFEEAGTYPFICTIHPNMTGTVTVEG